MFDVTTIATIRLWQKRFALCSIYRGVNPKQFASILAMELRQVFATNLRRCRNAKGLSQDALAYEAEVSRSYLSQLEKGVFHASLKIVGRLAEALDIETSELLRTPARKGPRR
jgi:DNA-binding XRE family transcriptional regulator